MRGREGCYKLSEEVGRGRMYVWPYMYTGENAMRVKGNLYMYVHLEVNKLYYLQRPASTKR